MNNFPILQRWEIMLYIVDIRFPASDIIRSQNKGTVFSNSGHCWTIDSSFDSRLKHWGLHTCVRAAYLHMYDYLISLRLEGMKINLAKSKPVWVAFKWKCFLAFTPLSAYYLWNRAIIVHWLKSMSLLRELLGLSSQADNKRTKF